MKVVKKTAEYFILQRRDGRYAVRDRKRRPINGEAKVEILRAEGLISASAPRPQEEAAESSPEA